MSIKSLIAAFALLAGAMAPFSVNAQWQIGETAAKDAVYAGTINDSGMTLARYCYYKDEICYWQIFTSLSCTPGESYPAMITAGVTAQVTLICEGKTGSDRHGYFIKPFDSADELIRKGSVLGLVMVSADDNFNVYRFKLDGALKALTDSQSLFYSRRSTKDMRL